MRDWHRIFGVSLADVVTGLPFQVIQELELSRTKHRLDVAIIRTVEAAAPEYVWADLPDGLTDLADHSLVSYKSMRESLTPGAVWELVVYAVMYGKQQWKKGWEAAVQNPHTLRLLAVTTCRPAWLTAEVDPGFRKVLPGVYEIDFLQLTIRVIVPRDVAPTPRNALWHLLSGDAERVRFGMENYRPRDADLYNVLNDLRENYSLEGLEMPYTKEDYKREVRREILQKMSPAERSELVLTLPADERRELVLKMPPSERLTGLSVEQLEAYLNELRQKRRAGGDAADRN